MTSEDIRLEQLQKLLSDKEIADVFHGTNFGACRDEKKIIADTLLKIAGGYSSGHTAYRCCEALGLIKKMKGGVTLTANGKKYLFWSHTS